MNALEPSRTAILLIDLQRQMVDQALAPHSGAEVVARCVALADAARAAGALVVVVRFDQPGVDPQSAGSQLVPEVAPHPGDLEITKRTWGPFQDTGLDATLRERGVDTLVVAGVATNYGVEQTARIGYEIGYRVVLPQDAMSGLQTSAHEFAVNNIFRALGTVCTTAEAVDALGG
ncbi:MULTISPECIES: isochorismatase family protein [unclassified Micromonospora]|uniref:isochorismatase family protein n=1 Tax=unclassified Micromonospora TaxID=2617518 RepID=UPI0033A6F8BE